MNKNRINKGFTLAEMIVAVVILAILVGVTLGGLNEENINFNSKR